MRRRLLAVLGVAAVLLLAQGLWLPRAEAHATLEETRPGNDEVLQQAPTEVSLRFDEPVAVVGSGLRVFGPDGARVDRGRSAVDGKSITIGIRAPARGTYTVSWRVISGDSHNLSGSFIFHVGVKTGAVDVDDSQNPLTSAAGGLGRLVAFAAAMVLLGCAAVVLLSSETDIDKRLRSTAFVAAVVGGVATVVVLGYQAAQATGHSLPRAATIFDLGWNTRTGRLTLLRAGLFVIAAELGAISGRWRWWLIGGAGAAIAVVVTINGHAWTSSSRPVAIAADVGHQLFVGLWLGGIAALLVGIRSVSDRSALVRRFSQLSLIAAGGTLLTGTVSGYLHVRELEGLTSTGYGQLLLAKVAGFTVLCGFGWLNRSRYLPALDRALKPFERSLWRSAGVAVLVLGLTATLVNQPPATVSLNKPFETRVVVGDALMQMSVTPARVGLNDVHLYFFDSKGGGGFGVDAVEVTAATGSIPPRRLTVTPVTASHQSVYGASLTTPGLWTITVTTLNSGRKTVFTAQVPIR